MVNAINIAASGLSAVQTQLAVTANNIANLDTPGYQSQGADLVELAGGGVAVSGISPDGSGGGANGGQRNNVDLAKQAVNLIQEKTLYNANAVVLRTSDQMFGTLLDIFDIHDQSNS